MAQKAREMKARFGKQFAKQLGKHPLKTQKVFERRLMIFLKNPFDALLSNHPLSGAWAGYRSVNISGDLRAIYEMINQETAYFVAFGTHSQLYR